ncbi:Uncharacterized protein Rs2_32220 [Raphanus sativus]|nr:Uncharacterized protein Rs2_32220 [Raphanus sativus]
MWLKNSYTFDTVVGGGFLRRLGLSFRKIPEIKVLCYGSAAKFEVGKDDEDLCSEMVAVNRRGNSPEMKVFRSDSGGGYDAVTVRRASRSFAALTTRGHALAFFFGRV